MSATTGQIEWYIARDGQQHGPLSQRELDKFIEFGHLKPTDLLWRAGFPDWRLAADVYPPSESGAEPTPGAGEREGAATPATSSPSNTADGDRNASARHGHGRSASRDGDVARQRQADAMVMPGPEAGGRDWSPHARASQPATAGGRERWTAPEARAREEAWHDDPEDEHTSPLVRGPEPDHQRGHAMAPQAGGPAQPGRAFEARWGGAGGGPAPQPAGHHEHPIRGDDDDFDDGYEDDDFEDGRGGGWLGIAATLLILALIGAGGWFAYNNQHEIVALYSDLMGERKVGDSPVAIVKAPEEANREAARNSETAQPTLSSSAQPVAPGGGVQADVPLLKSAAWSFAQQEFGAWAARQTEKANEMAGENKSKTEINSYLVDAFVEFRRDNAALALLASPEHLEQIAAAFVESLRALTARGSDSCYAYISSGEGTKSLAPVYFEPNVGERIEAQMLATMRAIVDARATPVTRSPPSAEDFDKLSNELNKHGWSDAELKLFSNPDALSKAQPALVCRLVTEWFATQTTLGDPDARDRLIAASLRPVIGG